MYDYAIVIMRAQPFHNHHKALLDRALTVAPTVFVVLGSCSDKRTARNPFLPAERRRMIKDCYPGIRLNFIEAADHNDDIIWAREIRNRLPQEQRGALVCNTKLHEPHYGDLFPNLDGLRTFECFHPSATDIRYAYFDEQDICNYGDAVPDAVLDYLEAFRDTADWWEIVDLRLGEQIA